MNRRSPRIPLGWSLAQGAVAIALLVGPVRAESLAPEWPQKVCSAGAMVPANLATWKVESPAGYSGHYVSQSVTDGSLDWRVTVRPGGRDTAIPWMVDVHERDDRDGEENEDRSHVDCPLVEGLRPGFLLGGGGQMMFFALYTSSEVKQAKPRPVLVGTKGDYFVLKPRVPERVKLADEEREATFKPWKAADPLTYAGRYVSLSPARGSSELSVVIRRVEGSRVPWRIDTVRKDRVRGEDDEEYGYRNRPLWQEEWPHVSAYDTYLFVEFTDPRKPGVAPLPALVTEKGEVLVKEGAVLPSGR